MKVCKFVKYENDKKLFIIFIFEKRSEFNLNLYEKTGKDFKYRRK